MNRAQRVSPGRYSSDLLTAPDPKKCSSLCFRVISFIQESVHVGRSIRLANGAETESDVFVVAAVIGTPIDAITDFTAPDDTIWLEDSVLSGLAARALAASAFVTNTSGTPTTAVRPVLYETDTGPLNFDAAGDGSGAAV